MNMRLHKSRFLAAVLLSSVSARSIAADAPATLEQRVQILEQQIQELNRRLGQQELPAAAEPGKRPASNTAVSAAPTTSGPPGWQSAGNWKKMRAGMNQDQVLDLLGEAESRSGGKYRQRWEYANGGGWVEFDSGGEVNEWHAP